MFTLLTQSYECLFCCKKKNSNNIEMTYYVARSTGDYREGWDGGKMDIYAGRDIVGTLFINLTYSDHNES